MPSFSFTLFSFTPIATMIKAHLRTTNKLFSTSKASGVIYKCLGIRGIHDTPLKNATEINNESLLYNLKESGTQLSKKKRLKIRQAISFLQQLEKLLENPQQTANDKFYLTYFTEGAKIYTASELLQGIQNITGYRIIEFDNQADAKGYLSKKPLKKISKIFQRYLDHNQETLFREQKQSPVSKIYCAAANFRKSCYSFSGYGIWVKDANLKLAMPIGDKDKKAVLKAEITSIFRASDFVYRTIKEFEQNNHTMTLLPKYKICCPSAEKLNAYVSKYIDFGPKEIDDLDIEDLSSLKKIVEVKKFYESNKTVFGEHEFEITSSFSSDDSEMIKHTKKLAYSGVAKGADPRFVDEILDMAS